MTRRLTAFVRTTLRRMWQRPVVTATALLVATTLVLSLVCHWAEPSSRPPYDTYWGTVRGLIGSAMTWLDANPARSVVGHVCAMLLWVGMMAYIGLVTACIAGSYRSK